LPLFGRSLLGSILLRNQYKNISVTRTLVTLAGMLSILGSPSLRLLGSDIYHRAWFSNIFHSVFALTVERKPAMPMRFPDG
jgi:hypothetical protein